MIFLEKNIYDIKARKCGGVGTQPFISGASAYPIWLDFSEYKLPNGDPITSYSGFSVYNDAGVLLSIIASPPNIYLDGGVLYGDANTMLTPFANTCFYLEVTLTGASGTIVLRTDLYQPQGDCGNNCSYLTISSYLNGYDCINRFIGQSDDMSNVFSNELLIFGELTSPLPKYGFGTRIDDCTNATTTVTEKIEAISLGLSLLAQKELAAIVAAGTVIIKEISLSNGVVTVISLDKWTLQTTEPFIVREGTCNCMFDFGGEFLKCGCELDTCATQSCGVGLECEYELYDKQVFQANRIIVSPIGFSFRFATGVIRNAYVAACLQPNASIVTVSGTAVPFTFILQSFNTTATLATSASHSFTAPIDNFIPECLDGITPQILDQALYNTLTNQITPITLTVSKVRLKYTPVSVPPIVGVIPIITGYSYTNSGTYPTMVTQVGNELQVLPYLPPPTEGLMQLTANIDTGFCEGSATVTIQE